MRGCPGMEQSISGTAFLLLPCDLVRQDMRAAGPILLDMARRCDSLEYVIYGDVLATVNFIIDLALLRLCSRISGLAPRGARAYLAAAVGALWSFAIFLPNYGFFWELLLRLGASVSVIFTAYGRQKSRVFLRLTIIFFTVGFIAAGFCLLFPAAAAGNGAVYFDVSPLTLLFCISGAYLFITAFERIFRRRCDSLDQYTISASRGGRSITFQALGDTGNHLEESFSGLPVVVISLSAAKPLLTDAERFALLSGREGAIAEAGLRPVLYSTVSGSGILGAFRPDKTEVYLDGMPRRIDVYFAVSPRPVGGEESCAIFNPRQLQALLS